MVYCLVGKGSLGRVYRAHRLSDKLLVAVKVLRENLSNDEEALARFKREAQMLSIIEHPNIVHLYDYGETASGECYFAAEYLAGETLASLISTNRCLTISEAEPIISQVCEALAEAHSHGFIHRDIKPSNIILVDGEEGKIAKLVDFSLAKLPPLAVEDKVTKDGMLRGTPAYMSPEQCQSMEVDYRSDIYSLAITIFETLTGTRPFYSKNSVITMHQQMNDPPPLLMAVRPDLYFCEELESLVQVSLSKKPAQRPETIESFYEQFKVACSKQKEAALTPPAYVERPVVESINKLSPLEAFREADERRIVRDRILSGADDDPETIRMSQEELDAQRSTLVDQERAIDVEAKVLSAAQSSSLVYSIWASDLGRKVILGSIIVVLLIILIGAFLFTPIPGPDRP